MIDFIGIGSPFVDYFFEADSSFLKHYQLKPEDDIIFGDRKNLTLKHLLKTLPLLSVSAGGISANTTAALAALKIRTGYYGVIGKDNNGALWGKSLYKADLSHVVCKRAMSICACILTNNRENRLFVSQVNPTEQSFFRNLDFAYLEKAKIIHISPFFYKPEAAIKNCAKMLDRLKTPKISFSPAMIYCKFGLSALQPILKKTYILFVNADELKMLTKKSPDIGSKKLLAYGPEIIVCTLGEKGVLVTTAKSQFTVSQKKAKKIIDSTGAGDSFAAGFLYGVLKGKTVKQSAQFGNKIALLALSDFGLHWLKTQNKKLKELLK